MTDTTFLLVQTASGRWHLVAVISDEDGGEVREVLTLSPEACNLDDAERQGDPRPPADWRDLAPICDRCEPALAALWP